jgi:threonine/homoserine/homoserine lactone efflux protein
LPDLTTYLSFLGVLIAWQIVPGSNALFVISRGLAHGRFSALWTVVGMTAGAGAFAALEHSSRHSPEASIG